MSDYRSRFARCGRDVVVEEGVHIEHPEVMEVGDGVRFMRGFWMGMGRPGVVRIGADVTFYPNCFIQGAADRFEVGEHVEFFPGTYISLGGKGSFVEVGHHSHFAPNCVLYGWGGLKFGAYCNVAAHCVFATIGHDQVVRDRPMALVPGVSGPITLEEDVWVAANCTVCAGVTIARGCIIGANSVVTRGTEPMGLYVGVPARRLRDRV
jgi:acetyltransferase-like isoleucine patch superfamily enzyme